MKIGNFFLKLDIIEPEIKLSNFKKTGTRNQTFFGAFFSIAAICMSILIAVYFFMDIIVRKNPKAFQVTRYDDDTKKIVFDQSGMFFALRIWSPVAGNFINESAMTFYAQSYTAKYGKFIGQWKFEKCIWNDFQGLDYLFSDYKVDIDGGLY